MSKSSIREQLNNTNPLATALLLFSFVSVVLFWIGAIFYDEAHYWYLNWNLLLAWVPLLLALGLARYLQKNSWQKWQAIGLTLLWLGFLPNSFYMVSDLIHLQTDYVSNPIFATVMIMSFALNGLTLGFISLYIIHRQLLARARVPVAHYLIAAVILLCSFAIYLGRELRWNTWDVLVNPAGLLFDVSEGVIINPTAHPQIFVTTSIFFVLIGSLYIVIWQAINYLKTTKD